MKVTRPRILTLLLALAVVVCAQRAEAQARFGGQLSYASEIDDGSLGLGARVGFGLANLPGLSLSSTLDYFFPGCGGCTYWQVNGNVAYTIPTQGRVSPYFGSGLKYHRFAADTPGGSRSVDGAAFNILGGFELATNARLTPFLEARVELMTGDDFDDQFVVSAGVVF